MRNIIVDIGGTFIRFGTDSTSTAPLKTLKTPNSRDKLIECLIFEIQTIMSREIGYVDKIFVSCPGVIDGIGKVQKALYVPLSGVNLSEELSQRIGKQTIVINDANIQAVGCWTGRNLLYINIGTAIGGAYIYNGHIFYGSSGFACEFGHVDIGSGIKCTCGRTGCLDTVASGRAFIDMFGDLWWKKKNESEVSRQIGIAGENVGKTLAQLSLLFEPEEICVTGRISAEPLFQKKCNMSFMENAWYDLSIKYQFDTWVNLNRGINKIIKGECEL